jgi:hypothetical protein
VGRSSLVLAAALSSCAVSQKYFQPAPAAGEQTSQGYGQATYDVVLAGIAVGEMRVSSLGAITTESHGTQIQIGFELTSSGRQALTLDPRALALDVTTTSGEVDSLPAVRVDGATRVLPGSASTAEAYFSIDDLSPGDVYAYCVRWRVQGESAAYAQVTQFSPVSNQYAYGPHWAWSPWLPYDYPYNPFLYPPPFSSLYPPGARIGFGVYAAPPPRHRGHDRQHDYEHWR